MEFIYDNGVTNELNEYISYLNESEIQVLLIIEIIILIKQLFFEN